MIIDNDVLEKTCKDMIETILFCLNDATKGTIYRVSPMPKLQVVRVTTGVREESSDQILWGLPEISDYNFPGKNWEQYRDRPGYVREAMAWCVDKQKSWTADDPYQDFRSVRKQLSGEIEDFHHMEPVLVRKAYLFGDDSYDLQYPVDSQGEPIWTDTEFVVVAVIKIYFRAHRVARGDRSTQIIKKLSRTLGTELLSLHVRETLSQAQKELARQRLQSCNVLAHELRNTLIKLGFVFSAINAEISFLREQWECELGKVCPTLAGKKEVLGRLTSLLDEVVPAAADSPIDRLRRELLGEQKELSELSLMPQVGEKWLRNRIGPKWDRLLSESDGWEQHAVEVRALLSRLRDVIWEGTDEKLADQLVHLPLDLSRKWQKIAYVDFSIEKVKVLDEILEFLDHPALDIPHKQQTRKVLTSLKALVEVIPEVEERANRIIRSLRHGDNFNPD